MKGTSDEEQSNDRPGFMKAFNVTLFYRSLTRDII